MKVIHIESGLGNQMLAYCEYLALKRANPDDEFYLETIIFDIPECNELICQWNGYELEKIFGIDTPKNLSVLFSDEEWQSIMDEIRATKFWMHNWNYPVAITNVLRKHGIELENIRGDFDPDRKIIGTGYQQKITWKHKVRNSWLGVTMKRYIQKWNEQKYLNKKDNRQKLFFKTKKSIFTGQWLSMKYRNNDRHLIDEDIRQCFRFSDFSDEKNIEMARFLDGVNAVAIHARRGDMLGDIAWCYKYGYFKRAVKHIKKMIKNPVFVFFTNPGSMEWCKKNAGIFALDFSKDKIYFVDWNDHTQSYKDMQLMGHCKHAIITVSTFGWWGAYFIKNPSKITISPDITIDTTYHC